MIPYQDYKIYTIRDAAILTNSYVAGTVLGAFTQSATTGAVTDDGQAYMHNQLEVLVDFTIGSLTTGEIKIEFSTDNTNWYQETYDDIAAATGVITERQVARRFSATGKYRIAIPIKDRYIRVSAIGNGTVTSSSMAITGVIGTV